MHSGVTRGVCSGCRARQQPVTRTSVRGQVRGQRSVSHNDIQGMVVDGTIETVKFVKSRSQKDAGIRLIENFALCRNNVTGHAGGP